MAAEDREKARQRRRVRARCWFNAIKKDMLPRDIVTRKSIENAISLVMAIGGSTNAVLHLLAIAHAAEVPLDDRRFRDASAGRCRCCAI